MPLTGFQPNRQKKFRPLNLLSMVATNGSAPKDNILSLSLPDVDW